MKEHFWTLNRPVHYHCTPPTLCSAPAAWGLSAHRTVGPGIYRRDGGTAVISPTKDLSPGSFFKPGACVTSTQLSSKD